MVNNRNTSIFKNIHDRLNIRDGNFFDNAMPNHITPVLEVDKPLAITRANTLASGGSTGVTIYTTPTDKDFYLSTATLGYTKDSTATTVYFLIRYTQEGTSYTICRMPVTSLLAGTGIIHCNFPIPLKIDRNTNISIEVSTNVATFSVYGTITGYISDSLQY